MTGDHQIAIVDTSFLETFDVELISGDRRTALSAPNGVILAERAAKVIFGDRDPMGQTLTVDHRQVRGEYTVTGVAKDPRWTVYALNFNLITAQRPPAVAWDRVLMSGPWRAHPDVCLAPGRCQCRAPVLHAGRTETFK